MNRRSNGSLETTIRRILRQYPFELVRDLKRLNQPVQGFSGALVIPLQTNQGERFCLRRWPPRSLPLRRLMELHRFLRFLQTMKIDCLPVPLETRQNRTLVECDGHSWQLEPWMPGVADFQQTPNEHRLNSVMRMLARLHEVASRYESTEAGHEWFGTQLSPTAPAIAERIPLIDHWTPLQFDRASSAMRSDKAQAFGEAALEFLERSRQMHAHVRAELQRCRQVAVPVHPCLRDLWHDHVLFTGDDVTGLIDPAATRSDTVATDLARLLGSLLGDMQDPRWTRALHEYERVRPLSIPEHRLISVLHVSGVLLSGLTWVERRLNGTLTEPMLPRVVARLQGFCRCVRLCQQV